MHNRVGDAVDRCPPYAGIPNVYNSVHRRHQMERYSAPEELLLGFEADVPEAVFYISSECAGFLTSGWYWGWLVGWDVQHAGGYRQPTDRRFASDRRHGVDVSV
jgi:hypothetical protein